MRNREDLIRDPMFAKSLLFMLAFFGLLVACAGLMAVAILVVQVDVNALLTAHPEAVCIGFALFGAIITLLYFRLQDLIFVFRPERSVSPVPQDELIGRLQKAFDTPVAGKPLFDFACRKNRVVVTWSASIDYLQLGTAGGRGKKRVVVLTFRERQHDVFFLMKEKDWGWDLSKNAFSVSLSYAAGIFAEIETEYRPSIAVSKEGGLTVDIKKLHYNSNDLWLPIQDAVLAAGWTLRGGMVPGRLARILFAFPMALLFLLMALFVTWVAGSSPAIIPAVHP